MEMISYLPVLDINFEVNSNATPRPIKRPLRKCNPSFSNKKFKVIPATIISTQIMFLLLILSELSIEIDRIQSIFL